MIFPPKSFTTSARHCFHKDYLSTAFSVKQGQQTIWGNRQVSLKGKTINSVNNQTPSHDASAPLCNWPRLSTFLLGSVKFDWMATGDIFYTEIEELSEKCVKLCFSSFLSFCRAELGRSCFSSWSGERLDKKRESAEIGDLSSEKETMDILHEIVLWILVKLENKNFVKFHSLILVKFEITIFYNIFDLPDERA